MRFELPALPYAYDALEPYMSAETLEYHHDKHHAAYLNNMNSLLEKSDYEGQSLEEIVKKSFKTNQALFNNAAQFYNHLYFWQWMTKNGGGKNLPSKIAKAIDNDLGGYDKFRQDFLNAGMTQFGAGWAWLAVQDGKLKIMKTLNGENPLVYDATPILGVDVWEHSYYIDYRNARQKYLENFIDHLVHWDYVESLYEKAI